MIFLDNALAETAPAWDAKAIRLSLNASIEQATAHEEGAARRSSSRRDHLLPLSIHRLATLALGHRITPEDGSKEGVYEHLLLS